MQYGKLTPIKEVGKNDRNEKLYECLCECGNVAIVKLPNLKSGHTQSCGCISSGPKAKNLTGTRFGKLVAIALIGKTKWRTQLYECICDCGLTVVTNSRDLKSGATKSCGCLKKESDNNRIGPKNPNYDPSIPDLERSKRRSVPGLADWKKAVKERAKCEVCSCPTNLTAHHIESWKNAPELRVDYANGACLCNGCHISFHRKYGFGTNTRAQYDLFLEWAKLNRPQYNGNIPTKASNKQCIKCFTEKSLEKFVKSNHTPDGRTNVCKDCANERARWKRANLPQHRENVLRSEHRSYRKKHMVEKPV
jgi:hypothetical protein